MKVTDPILTRRHREVGAMGLDVSDAYDRVVAAVDKIKRHDSHNGGKDFSPEIARNRRIEGMMGEIALCRLWDFPEEQALADKMHTADLGIIQLRTTAYYDASFQVRPNPPSHDQDNQLFVGARRTNWYYDFLGFETAFNIKLLGHWGPVPKGKKPDPKRLDPCWWIHYSNLRTDFDSQEWQTAIQYFRTIDAKR